jgi:hypothetical protein
LAPFRHDNGCLVVPVPAWPFQLVSGLRCAASAAFTGETVGVGSNIAHDPGSGVEADRFFGVVKDAKRDIHRFSRCKK